MGRARALRGGSYLANIIPTGFLFLLGLHKPLSTRASVYVCMYVCMYLLFCLCTWLLCEDRIWSNTFTNEQQSIISSPHTVAALLPTTETDIQRIYSRLHFHNAAGSIYSRLHFHNAAGSIYSKPHFHNAVGSIYILGSRLI